MNFWKLSTFALIGALAIIVSGSHVSLAQAEPQPRMEAALRHLGEAKAELKEAMEDKGGHRAKALELTERAIKQVEEGIAWADRHDRR